MLKPNSYAVVIVGCGFIVPGIVLLAQGFNPFGVIAVLLFAAAVAAGWLWVLNKWLSPRR